jgi:hypothetical protein
MRNADPDGYPIHILGFDEQNKNLKIYSRIFQGFGSGSAWIRINLRSWIRIRIQIADPDPGCSFLRAEGFSCSFGVLYGGLGIGKL